MKLAAAYLCWSLLIFIPTSKAQDGPAVQLTRSEISSITQAIEDEIYDYEYQEQYFPEGGPVGDEISSTRVRVPLYIEPELRNGEGRAIYKLMPHGELLRYFHVLNGGIIRVEGDPQLGFPASQPSRKTVYLRDSELTRMKHNWIKSSFVIDLSPTPERVREAVRRQKERTGGFSAWEFARSKGNKKLQP